MNARTEPTSDRKESDEGEPWGIASRFPVRLALYWVVVLTPLGYGIYNTLLKAIPLFQ